MHDPTGLQTVSRADALPREKLETKSLTLAVLAVLAGDIEGFRSFLAAVLTCLEPHPASFFHCRAGAPSSSRIGPNQTQR